MIDPQRKILKFKFGHSGMMLKEDPTLLTDAQYRNALNVEVFQEGSIATRAGKKLLGILNTAVATFISMIRKMVVTSGEDPAVPATNPRYIGLTDNSGNHNLYRSTDYTDANTNIVASTINASQTSAQTKPFGLAVYTAGESGGPWAFIACEKKMLKDSGLTPYSNPLHAWGIIPAPGVATATLKVNGSASSVSAITYGYPAYPTGFVITLAAAASLNDFDNVVFTGVTNVTITSNNTVDNRTNINDSAGWSIRAGLPLSDGTFFNLTTMFRIYDNSGIPVAGTSTYAAGGTVVLNLPDSSGTPHPQTGLAVIGTLDGGANHSPAGSVAYDWRYIYVASDTNNFGNPSQTMLTDNAVVVGGVSVGQPVTCHLREYTITVQGISTTTYPGLTTIQIYRRGGTLGDTWRLIGAVTNSGTSGSTATLLDNVLDNNLRFAPTIEFDNDPPVPSTVQSPIIGTFTAAITTAGRNTVNTSLNLSSLGVTPGTLMHLFTDSPEDVILELVTTTSVTAYFQHTHLNGATFEIDAITGQPCNLTTSYSDFVVVAGDPNNPHLLYRSKGDHPESFPLITTDGTVASITCGTPGNPIMQVYEFRGQIVTINLYTFYETMILNGSLVQASQVASVGTVGTRANCKTNTDIWTLHYDGVWSWDGSTATKRSESIDGIFHGQYVNGLSPINFALGYACVMESRRQQIYLLYADIANVYQVIICEPLYGDRWRRADGASVEFFYAEPDTETMVEGSRPGGVGNINLALMDQYKISSNINYTADYFTGAWAPPSSTNGGSAIAWDLRLPWFDMGSPSSKKFFEEAVLELDVTNEANAAPADMLVELSTDFSDAAVDSLTVTLPGSPTGRTLLSLQPNLQTVGGALQAYGREARAISYHIAGHAWPAQVQLYSLTLYYNDTELLSAGGSSNWMDLGYPHDKRLYQMTVTFDTQGVDRAIVVDAMTGIHGNIFLDGQTNNFIFTLSNVSHTFGTFVAKKTFPMPDGFIAKMVRVRPYSSASGAGQAASTFFKIFSVEFPEMEQYPPDIITATSWEDDNHPFPKYINQATLIVNTGNVGVTVQIQADGSTVATEVVTSTESDRNRNLTLPTGLQGRRWRLRVDPTQAAIASGGGRFQLWNNGKIFRFQPADQGEVAHTFDFDDLGHPYDKLLISVVIEYDTTAGGPVTLQMDTISGIGGVTLTPNVTQFVLGNGRGKSEFPIPADTIAKMIQLYPLGTPNVGYKQWKYKFQKIDYPPDRVRVTEWRNASAVVDKEPSWLWLDMDTASVAASVQLQNEAGTVMTVNHTGTTSSRDKNYAIPADTRAKMWRLVLSEGVSGKTQLFEWGFSRWQAFPLAGPVNPPESVLAVPWSDFGWPYGSIARNLILTINTGGIACSVQLIASDTGATQTFSVTTTNTNRRVVLACTAGLIGELWRLLLTPGGGGLAQLWDWQLDIVKLPAAVTSVNLYEQDFGYMGYKWLFEGWLEYDSTQTLTVTILTDGGASFFTTTLAAHAHRDVERFFFPAIVGSVLNKSKIYNISISSSATFRLYSNSYIDWLPWNADTRQSLQHFQVSSEQPLPVS